MAASTPTVPINLLSPPVHALIIRKMSILVTRVFMTATRF
ncbi:Uncharacterised protein [Vibrio cholerae]|nr:Uncharacterised protein [Vibrio cholerae]